MAKTRHITNCGPLMYSVLVQPQARDPLTGR
jgi:hypothetical protein